MRIDWSLQIWVGLPEIRRRIDWIISLSKKKRCNSCRLSAESHFYRAARGLISLILSSADFPFLLFFMKPFTGEHYLLQWPYALAIHLSVCKMSTFARRWVSFVLSQTEREREREREEEGNTLRVNSRWTSFEWENLRRLTYGATYGIP